ncbi:hypothetical protein C8T65DRAFT_176577 [Cerioporus squamosus]|nr:hypothetical protein C8T65DRAFT_176577 [Cerioporus squamosus]
MLVWRPFLTHRSRQSKGLYSPRRKMSSNADAALFQSIYTGDYCAVAASALPLYEAIVTFDREVACFWSSKWTGAPLLFFANKWISVTYAVLELVRFARMPSDRVSTLESIDLCIAMSDRT